VKYFKLPTVPNSANTSAAASSTSTSTSIAESDDAKQVNASLRWGLELKAKILSPDMSMRMAGVASHAKLQLVQCKSSSSVSVKPVGSVSGLGGPGSGASSKVCVTCDGNRYIATVPSSISLWRMLENIESTHDEKPNLTARHGVPEPEKHALFTLHVNVPGYLQPVLELMGHTFDEMDDLKTTTLHTLGITGRQSASFRLTHKYVAPPVDEKEAQATIQRFRQRFQQVAGSQLGPMTGQSQSQSQASSMNIEVDETQSQAITQPRQPRPTKIWITPVSTNHRPSRAFDSIPDELFEVTTRDFQIYSKAIRANASATATPPPVDHSSTTRIQYDEATIRVRLPNFVFLESQFRATDTIGHVQDWVDSYLTSDTPPVALFVTPPKTMLNNRDQTLRSAGLAPRAIVYASLPDVAIVSREQADQCGRDISVLAPFIAAQHCGSIVLLPEPNTVTDTEMT
jgi:UBX domain